MHGIRSTDALIDIDVLLLTFNCSVAHKDLAVYNLASLELWSVRIVVDEPVTTCYAHHRYGNKATYVSHWVTQYLIKSLRWGILSFVQQKIIVIIRARKQKCCKCCCYTNLMRCGSSSVWPPQRLWYSFKSRPSLYSSSLTLSDVSFPSNKKASSTAVCSHELYCFLSLSV